MDVSAIVGQQLSSVTFVQDYLQLDFDGPGFTLFIWPEVFRDEGSYAFGEPGYRDALCSAIAENVTEASFETDVALEIQFESGTIFRMSLREEDYVSPEAGHFTAGQGSGLIVF